MAEYKDRTPDWAKRAVGYLCFVDSFASSIPDPEGKKDEYKGTAYGQEVMKLKWHETDPTLHHNSGYYGGDLMGAAYASSYLADLGIDMVYFTPIFRALSNHKYDTLDHMQIDPQFGTFADFENMVHAYHSKGIRVILDGVFNHTSSEHEWYKKAKAGDLKFKSMYKVNAEGYIMVWNGIETLPVLNFENQDVQKYFYSAPESVVHYWLKAGADGWRLDVAERLSKDAIAGIRQAVKAEGADKLLTGEVVETYGKEWLADGLLDGVMNYAFRGVTANFMTGKIDAQNYMAELEKMYVEYPREKLYTSWNLISTHDTNRMLYDVGNDEGLLKIAAVLQFTYPGIPMIYYGDELGTTKGEKEKQNRMGHDWEVINSYEKYRATGAMEWDKIKRYNSFHEFFKHMIWLKKTFTVLVDGDFYPACASGDVAAFFRVSETAIAFIIVNKGLDASVKIKVPEEVLKRNPDLKCAYGGNGYFKPRSGEIEFYIGGKNAYLFIG
jgi:glycosidase